MSLFLGGARPSRLPVVFAACVSALMLSATTALAKPGDLDGSFGQGGKVVTQLGDFNPKNSSGRAVALAPDGDLVVAGSARMASGGDFNFGVARYNPDGSLDQSFGFGGKVTTPLGIGGFAFATDVTVLPNGQIVAVGLAKDGGGKYEFGLVRYNTTGDLLGSSTVPVGNENAEATSVAALSDGGVVVAGVASNNAGAGADFALIRYDAQGSPVSSFGPNGNGTVITPIGDGGQAIAYSVVALPGNGIVVAGVASNTGKNYFALARYNASGQLAGSFDGDGKVLTAIGDGGGAYAQSLTVLPGGDLVAGGYAADGGVSKFALVRYNADSGKTVDSYGSNGRVLTPIDEGAAVNSMVPLPNGGLIAAGYSDQGSFNNFAVARYGSDGSLDQSFGSGGKVVTNLSGVDGVGNESKAEDVVVLPDGDLVAAGTAQHGQSQEAFALVRYQGNDTTSQNSTPPGGGSGTASGGGTTATTPSARCFAFSGAAAAAKSKRVAVAKKLKVVLALAQPKKTVKADGTLPVKLSAVGGKKVSKRLAKLVKQVTFTVNGKVAGKDRKAPFSVAVKRNVLKAGANRLKATVRLKKGSKKPAITLNVPIKQVGC